MNEPLLRNRILAALSTGAQSRIAHHLKHVSLSTGTALYEPDATIRMCYFMTDGLISLLTTSGSGESVQTTIIGREGFLGVPVVLDCNSDPSRAIVEVGGTALGIGARELHELLKSCDGLRRLLNRYAMSRLTRVRQRILCSRLHSTEKRLATTLLMVSSRVGTEFRLTHETMAQMIGSRRLSVTRIARKWQLAGVIQYKYGRVTISSRTRLARQACECYEIQRREYGFFPEDGR